MKVSILVDTNALFVTKYRDFSKVEFLKKIEILVNDLNLLNQNGITLVLSQIVVDELLKQQVEEYKRVTKEIRNIKLPSVKINNELEYMKELEKIYRIELESIRKSSIYNIVIAPFPKSDTLPNIIQRSIDKRPPFEGLEKKSDKGFKDTILWESLLEYKNNNRGETIIFLTSDKIFQNNKNVLMAEYNSRFIDDMFIVNWYPNKNKELVDILEELYNKKYEMPTTCELFENFKQLIKKSNLIELFEGDSFYNSLDEEEYILTECRVKECLFYQNATPYITETMENYFYFVPELEISFVFYNDNRSRSMTLNDFIEFEIYYYPDRNEFTVVGHDDIKTDACGMTEEFVIKSID